MSEAADAKEQYDRYFSWLSGFGHANWAAVRNSVFAVCLNPLHRLHRVPRAGGVALEDVVPDAVGLADAMLATLAALYPPFTIRLATI